MSTEARADAETEEALKEFKARYFCPNARCGAAMRFTQVAPTVDMWECPGCGFSHVTAKAYLVPAIPS